MNRTMLLLALAICCVAPFATAEDGWDLTLGAGVAQSPVYEGSRDYYISPFPTVVVSYTTGDISFSASVLDGLGVTYMDGERGILASVSLSSGPERNSDGYDVLFRHADHSDETGRMLEDTPTVKSIVTTNLTLGVVTPVGLVGAGAGYLPTSAEKTYHGFIGSLFYMLPVPIGERAQVTAIATLEAMDSQYADAWYSLAEDTDSLDAFDADAGLRATQLVVEGGFQVTDQFGVSLLVGEVILLGDAARSPFTEERFQTSVMLQALYCFL
jgi:outer membrane scaffolding protein for murein synthesis (MipA/OmpV family)